MLEPALKSALQVLVPTWTLEEVSVVAYLEGGYSNDNYQLQYQNQLFALRTPQRSQPFVDRGHEQLWLDRLPKSIGVAPLAYDVDSGYMLSPWIEGTLLVDAWQDQSPEVLVSYLVQLHEQLPDAERTYDLKRLMFDYKIEDLAPQSTSFATTCHNDLNPWNIIVSNEGWITLDWEFVGYNDPLFDLIGLHQGLELPEAELPELCDLYLTNLKQDLQRARLDACIYNFWLREYGWAKYQLSQGNVRREIEEQLQVALNHLRQ